MSNLGYLKDVHDRMSNAAQKAGRNIDDVELVAISKYSTVGAIKEIYDSGQRIFGESKAQELRDKIPLLPSDISWHFIGPLQTNKLRYLVPSCHLIHSVESLEMAQALQKFSNKKQHITRVLVEVNSSEEQSKHGLAPEKALDVILEICAYPDIKVEGLMTIGPNTTDDVVIGKAFATTRVLLKNVNKQLEGDSLKTLSMGMSGDFEIAIREGSTMVRIGSAIFGTRRR